MEDWCEHKCSRKCGNGLTVAGVKSFRESFWSDVPTSRERRARIAAAIVEARENYLLLASTQPLDPNDFPDQLLFRTEDGKRVCQKYFANLVGMGDLKSFKNKLWGDEVKKFVGGIRENNTKKDKDTSQRCKREHAYAHIKKVVESQMMDMSAHVKFDNHYYLPYPTVTCFFDEYVYLSSSLGVPFYAKKTTFVTAFKQIVLDKKKRGIHIRMSSSKGMYILNNYIAVTCRLCTFYVIFLLILYTYIRIV